jgi:hypothetical protein
MLLVLFRHRCRSLAGRAARSQLNLRNGFNAYHVHEEAAVHELVTDSRL